MTEPLSTLPGTGCLFFTQGHCSRKISKDPAFHDKWRCSILEKWEVAFDAYLDQVECFEIEQDTIMKIWARRFETIKASASCADFVPGENSILSCALLHFDLCRKKMPPCPGRCRYFRREE